MEAVSRWLYSFVAYKDLEVYPHTRTVPCGKSVLLCSIVLTDPKSTFKDYYENKISVLYHGRNAEAVAGDCVVETKVISSRRLDVYCKARRAGRARVRLDLGRWYYFADPEIDVDIIPSSPKYLKNVEVRCFEKSEVEKTSTKFGTLYYGTKSLLKFNVVDEYGNLIKQIGNEDIIIELHDKNDSFTIDWKMEINGKMFAYFWPKFIGETQIMVRFVDKMNARNTLIVKIPINIFHPPCSPLLTLEFLDANREQRCRAGGKFVFQVQLYDIFGKAVLQDSKETCNISVQAPLPKTALKQHEAEVVEEINVEKVNSSEKLSVAVTACFKIAGFRKLELSAYSSHSSSKSCSKNIYLQVIPSTPCYLNDIRFSTDDAIDESFFPDPTMMYKTQWSIFEASIVDRYANVVQELYNDHKICLNLFDDEGNEMKMEYKDAEIRNGKLRVQVKICDAGKHNLQITLTSKTSPEQVLHLKDIQIQVNDAPFSIIGSEFHYPNTCVAGKKFQVEIIPLDVFGCPLPANSTIDYNLTAQISNYPLLLISNEETITSKVIKNESIIRICCSVVLTKGGRRKLIILDKNNKPRIIPVDVLPSTPKYLKNVEVRCFEKSVDEENLPEFGTLYYGTKSLLKFEMVDEYGNFVKQIMDEKSYNIAIELCNGNDCNLLGWKMKHGEVFAFFLPNLIGETQMMVRFTDSRSNRKENSTCTYQIPVNVLYPPCSPSLTLKSFDINLEQRCTAGKGQILKIELYDIFGKAVLQDSKETCNVVVTAPLSKTALKRLEKGQVEEINIEKINSSEISSVAITACFKIAGTRKLELIAKCGSKSSSKNVYLQVLPSTPHCLNNARFTTDSAIDKCFSADPTTMYRKQWSILEASVVDPCGNFVRKIGNDYSICPKLFSDKGEKMEMEYKDAEIQDGRLRMQMKINDAGTHNLLITLTSKTCPDQVFPLKELQIEVNDTPFSLVGSEFHYPVTCVAGKSFQVKIIPFDIFGCRLPANTTTDYNLTAEISNFPLQRNANEETIDIEVIKNESNVLIYFSVVLTTVGIRKLIIFDKDNKSKELNFEVNPDLNDVHWDLTTTPTETAHRRENLVLTVRLLDRFNNAVRNDSTENIPDLLKLAGPNGLHVAGKSMQSNIGTIQYVFKQSGKYDLCLADRNGNNIDGTSFTIIVQDAPLDHSRSSITWLPRYEDFPDQPVFPDDESFQCCLKLKDVVGFNYEKKMPKECFEVRYGKVKVEKITVSSSTNEIGSYVFVVPLLNLVKYDPSPEFWCFINGVKMENPLVLPTFEIFKQYDDDDCFVMRTRKSRESSMIVCRHVERRDIMGNDFCHLNNIKRVFELYDDPEIFECCDDFVDGDDNDDDDDDDEFDGDDDSGGGDNHYNDNNNDDDGIDNYGVDDGSVDSVDEFVCTIIKFSREEIAHNLEKCRHILLHLLRAIYYREEAFDSDKCREDWKDRARESYERKKGDRPRFCSQIKEKYATLMRRYHDAACDQFFQFFNAERGQSEIDLHGLLVVDEKKLQSFKRQLCNRGRLSKPEVEKKIEEERDHGNEAVRKLKEKLDNYDIQLAISKGEPWLEIIVGSGHHSKERQQIRPKVEAYLRRERKLEFKPVNKGALVVTFKEYSGNEPCFGEYYCPKCDSRWRNGRSYIGCWQGCYKCHSESNSLEKCYPLKQRSRKKPHSYNPKTFSRRQEPIPHIEELCKKCIELGHLCPCVPYEEKRRRKLLEVKER